MSELGLLCVFLDLALQLGDFDSSIYDLLFFSLRKGSGNGVVLARSASQRSRGGGQNMVALVAIMGDQAGRMGWVGRLRKEKEKGHDRIGFLVSELRRAFCCAPASFPSYPSHAAAVKLEIRI